MMKKCPCFSLAVLALIFLVAVYASAAQTWKEPVGRAPAAASPAAIQTVPTAVVAVNLVNAEFTVQQLKYRVFYNKSEVKRIPMVDYDFKTAFVDELMNALAEDKRMSWRVQGADEAIDVMTLLKGKTTPPPVNADRILLVAVKEYGAFLSQLGPDKFHLVAEFKLIDKATGKKLWHTKSLERIDFEGKLKDMQADNQKGLKEGINRMLEKLCPRIVADLRLKKNI
jgi:hypothetical protein